MSQPPQYSRAASFAGDERNNAGGRSTVRTAALDSELDSLGLTANATAVNLGLIQRDDGALRDGIVTATAMGADVLKLFAATGSVIRGAWATTTAYALKDVVTQGGNTYICASAHTSGTFATDLAAGKWVLMQLGANAGASSVSFTPTANLAATNVQAAIEESDAENRALSAAAAAASSQAAADLEAALAAPTGETKIGMQADVAGSVPTTFFIWSNGRTLDARVNFGADDTGASNTTAQVLAFFAACIANGRRGHIPAGSYLATAGQFVFSTPFADAAWPQIFTDGSDGVTFLRADATNAPMFQWNNGTATSGVGKYWRGGRMDGFTVSQNGKATAAGQHGVAMRGVWGMKTDRIVVNDAGGSALYMLPALYGGTNPDPYAVTLCDFEIEANRCKGYAVQNDNYVGMNLCKFRSLRAIECESGGFFGFGAANEVEMVTMGTIKGWAFDDGCALANTGGSPSRFAVREAELDDVQYGFRLNKASLVEIAQTRFVHRYNFSALNPSGGYWPRKVIEMAGGTAPAVNGISADFTHRIEAGGVKADMGAFVDGSSNGNVTNVRIAQRVIDNAGFGFSDTDLFTGLNSLATVELRRDGYRIADQMKKQYVRAEATVSTTIANTGFTSTKIQFPTEVADGLSRWNGANTFTASFAGPYRVKARIALTLSAAGKQVRMAWMVNSSAAAHKTMYSQGTGVQYYELDDIVTLAAGDTLWLSADQNDVASKTLSAPINIGIDNHVLIEAL